jgi:hypothetical protein
MKKLQIPIEDQLMADLKVHALKNNITLKDLVTQALLQVVHPAGSLTITSGTSITSITSTSTSTSIEPKKELGPSGIDWDNLEVDAHLNDDHLYYFEDRYDEDGNKYKVRIPKPTIIPDKKPDTIDDFDPNDPLEAAIREMYEKYGD